MNRENAYIGFGRILIGYLLGMILAVTAPLVIMTELLSLSTLILLPSIGLVFLWKWAGKGPAVFSALLQLVLNSMYLGSTLMWASFVLTILPLAVLMRIGNKPFFTQMKIGIGAFGAGVVAAVAVLYAEFGGNMFQRAIVQLPEILRSLPPESLQACSDFAAAFMGREITADGFYQLFEDMVAHLLPVYQANLPGLIFSGALLSAVICVTLGGLIRVKSEKGAEACPPLREWTLPASTTGGLLLIVAVSYVMMAAGVNNGTTVFYTVLNIAVTAFCIQTLSSVARKMHASGFRRGTQTAITAAVAVLSLLGANTYVAIYGCGSAVLGSRGALHQRIDDQKQDNNSSSDK